MKEVRFSAHSPLKMEILKRHGISINPEFVIKVIQSPDKLDYEIYDKRVAQKRLNANLVLRVVYREFSTFVFVITLYPGRRSRYEN